MLTILLIFLLHFSVAVSPIQGVLDRLGQMYENIQKDAQESLKLFEAKKDECTHNLQEDNNILTDLKKDLNSAKGQVASADGDITQTNEQIDKLNQHLSTNSVNLKDARDQRSQNKKNFQNRSTIIGKNIDILEKTIDALNSEGNEESTLTKDEQTSLLYLASAMDSIDRSVAIELNRQVKNVNFLQETSMKKGGVLTLLNKILTELKDELKGKTEIETKQTNDFNLLEQSIRDDTRNRQKDLERNKRLLSEAQASRANGQTKIKTTKSEIKDAKKDKADNIRDCVSFANQFEANHKERIRQLKGIEVAMKVIKEKTGGVVARRQEKAQETVEQETNAVSQAPAVTEAANSPAIGQVAGVSFLQKIVKHSTKPQLTDLAQLTDPGQFDKVIGLIKNMIAKLEDELDKEVDAKNFCDSELKRSTEEHKRADSRHKTLDARLKEINANLIKMTKDIKSSQSTVSTLNGEISTGDKLRAESKAEFEGVAKDNQDCIDGLASAIEIVSSAFGSVGAGEEGLPTEEVAHGGENSADTVIPMLEVAKTECAKALDEARSEEEEQKLTWNKVKIDKKQLIADHTNKLSSLNTGVTKAKSFLSETRADFDTATSELKTVVDYLAKLNKQCADEVVTAEQRIEQRKNEIAGLKGALEHLTTGSPDVADVEMALGQLGRVVNRHRSS